MHNQIVRYLSQSSPLLGSTKRERGDSLVERV
jgi:hypothetical protein